MSSSILNFFRKRSAGDEERDIQVTKRSRIEDSEDDYESETNISSVSGTTTEDTSTDTSAGSVSAKQALKFTNKWLKGREHWLEYIPSQGMFCKLCRKYDKHSYGHDIWNRTPCTRLRLQSIISHENSAAHRESVRLELTEIPSRNIANIINPTVPKRGMEQAFSCLYFLTKQRIPHTTNYEPMLDFLELLGLTVKTDIRVARNATYTSSKSIQEMVFILSEVIENKILNEMREADHFSLMFDETTDCSVTEQLSIHGRYIEKVTGTLKTRYLKVIDVLQPEIDALQPNADPELESCISVCASTITRRICEFTTEAELDRTRLRGIGTDGAATMIGRRSGVVTRLKETTPSAIGVHCAAHRLNLASSQAGNAVEYVKKFNIILRQLFDYFDNSAVRTAGLQAIQTLVQEKGKLLAPCSTRWLSTERSVNRLKACFTSVVLTLQKEGEEKSDAKAIGLSRLITEYRFVSTMLLLCDALPHVTHLSKCFQLTDCDYSIIPRMTASTVSSLEQLKVVGGVNLNGLQQFIEKLSSAGINLTKHGNLGEEYFNNSIRKPFLSCLVENIQNGFEDKSVMAAFDIFNPAKLPKLPTKPTKEELTAFAHYGNDEVESLAKQFSTAISDVEECTEEWASYRQYLNDNCSQLKHCEVVSDLCSPSSFAASVYPNMSTLAKICRVIPIHTADVERTFSQLKLIKTSIRNRMAEKTLDSLLRIVTEGPCIEEFPISDAVTLWAKKKNRRLSV